MVVGAATVRRLAPVLVSGDWRAADATGTFCAVDPATGAELADRFPISAWSDCEGALAASAEAANEMANQPPSVAAAFLEDFARRIDEAAPTICEVAQLETALPLRPRLLEVELPRTTLQLRQAAAAARDGSWRMATIDTANNLRTAFGPIGPVAVFGPNNFPLAFNSISGGDFAAAIAAGNPVIAKANPAHPRTTQLLAEQALPAVRAAGLPEAAVQLIYHLANDDGLELVRDERLGAIAFTGSRQGGMALKAAADSAGKPIYLEMSSVNPVFLLPGAVAERRAHLVDELAGSCLLGAGQFCTCPNLFVLFAGEDAETFVHELQQQFATRPQGTLLSKRVQQTLASSVEQLQRAGAELIVGGEAATGPGFRFANTLLRVSGDTFLKLAAQLQTEAFGNATLAVVVSDARQAADVAATIEGSLTGSIYSATNGADDAIYDLIAPALRRRVGRLINDRMPTGVVVSPAMNHGGPYPATGHPGFTAVGIPAAMRRFAMLECYDHVRSERLPPWLQNPSPNGTMWRLVDGEWTQGDVRAA